MRRIAQREVGWCHYGDDDLIIRTELVGNG